MNEAQRQRIVDRHCDALLRHGYHPHALYWSSRKIQWLRFEQLLGIGIKPGTTLLDFGCGFGDLLDFLTEREIDHGNYLGLDLSPELIDTARKRHPEAEFFEGELFDLDPKPKSFDVALLSGALNEALEDDGRYAKRVIARLFESARHGVAINLLDATHPQTGSRPDLQSFDPEQMAAWGRLLTPNTTLIRGYLENDFTLLLRHAEAPAGRTL